MAQKRINKELVLLARSEWRCPKGHRDEALVDKEANYTWCSECQRLYSPYQLNGEQGYDPASSNKTEAIKELQRESLKGIFKINGKEIN